ncbi:MAG: RNA-binding S4 domain-containing protein [Bacteroidales bacterium]|nr:RNA-binding S4 domain-containing protein [Bacteroidales bacterium]HPD95508.1 RNA-binding S4 domain-containing protein [Tenuifilaceae bacterium]HRX30647.1 RNA-binding S4 domain-containing protein [Tenuifilaceae bacterium]
MMEYKLDTEYIQLDKLLKICRIVNSGGEAHLLVENNEVKVNGNIETRKRAKIRIGDAVEALGKKIVVK